MIAFNMKLFPDTEKHELTQNKAAFVKFNRFMGGFNLYKITSEFHYNVLDIFLDIIVSNS